MVLLKAIEMSFKIGFIHLYIIILLNILSLKDLVWFSFFFQLIRALRLDILFFLNSIAIKNSEGESTYNHIDSLKVHT